MIKKFVKKESEMFKKHSEHYESETEELDEWYASELDEITQEYLDRINEGDNVAIEEYRQKVRDLIDKYEKLNEKNQKLFKFKLKLHNFIRPKKKKI